MQTKPATYFTNLEDLENQLQGFSVTAATYNASTQIKVMAGCYGWLAINYGDIIATVEQFPLLPRVAAGLIGGAFGFMDNGRIYKKKQIELNITAGGTDPRVVVCQIYLV